MAIHDENLDIEEDVTEGLAEGPGGSLEISLDDLDDDIDDEQPASRRDKRRQRGNRLKQAQADSERYRDEKEEMERKLQSLRSEFDSFRGQAQQWASDFDEPEDQGKDELSRLRDEEVALGKEWDAIRAAGKDTDPDLQKRYLSKHQNLKEQMQRVIVRQELQQSQRSQPRQDPATSAVRMVAETEYSDVANNRQALVWADAYHRQQVAKGRNADISLARESFEAARNEFKLGGRKARTNPPTEQERSRYAGVPSTGSPGGGGGKNTFTMTKEFRMMADAMYPPNEHPKLTDAQRYQKWVREVYQKK